MIFVWLELVEDNVLVNIGVEDYVGSFVVMEKLLFVLYLVWIC